ncbi:phosphoribosylamine--glycine ligase [bacterium]|nr:phosphoribosylamine--glycine ligase [bacterium]
MKILVIGQGGREHALCWKIAASPLVTQVFCAPGNAGTARVAKNLPVRADDVRGLVDAAMTHEIDLVVVGPEAPLVAGIADSFRAADIRVVGPTGDAARIEGSKAFAKELMQKAGIPTARAGSFLDYDAAVAYVDEIGAPLVVKADGLAAGKGVLICTTREEALDALVLVLRDRAFGAAGDRVLIEEFLEGEEASFIALTDGETVLPFASSQDHKRIGDGDTGPNTGGMGAYSPAPVVTPPVHEAIMERVMRPAVAAMRAEGSPFSGFLYAGLMIKDGAPKVLEFNARLGDPEAQALLARIDGDIVPALVACAEGRLSEASVAWKPGAAVCVVMASRGYPASSEKGVTIDGLDADFGEDVTVFHAGTRAENGRVVTDGGRVLGVTASGPDIRAAIDRAYAAVERISFDGARFRRDIGAKAVERA